MLSRYEKSRAFTLIEISIVMIVIGLVLGGVLVGRDLIKAAELRQQITQVESVKVAVNTFKNKYICLPGDCSNAFALGLIDADARNGDGNGLVQSDGCVPLGKEISNFWVMLGNANLIAGSYSVGDIPGINSPSLKMTGAGVNYNVSGGLWLTPSALPSGNFTTMSVNAITLATYGSNIGTGVYLPRDAHAIDSKIDDGLANKGSVFAQRQILYAMLGSICTIGSDIDWEEDPADICHNGGVYKYSKKRGDGLFVVQPCLSK